jgi:putative phosphoribosyl transferase
VLIVDDRAATGPAIRACIESANAAGATRIVVAFPVAPLMSAQASAMPADEVISLETLD